MMEVAEIVKATDEVHARCQSLRSLCYSTSATGQGIDPLTKAGIETFNKGCVDDAFALCRFDETFEHAFSTLYNPSIHSQNAFHALFDYLHDGDALPGNHLAPSQFSLEPGQLA